MPGHDAILAVLHLGIIQARILADDAFLVRVHETLPHVGRLKQRLGGYASHQQAGAPQSGLLLDESGFQSVLAGANGCGVAAGTTPDHYKAVRHFYHSPMSPEAVPVRLLLRLLYGYEVAAPYSDAGGGAWIRSDDAGAEEVHTRRGAGQVAYREPCGSEEHTSELQSLRH